MNIGIVGAGVFGLASAIALDQRGHQVVVYEQGAVPNPLASSTDLAKGMRRTWYAGDNATYVKLAEQSALQWRRWQAEAGTPLLHQTGHLSVVHGFEAGTPMYESYRYLRDRGATIEVLPAPRLRQRFPQFAVADDETGIFDAWGGYLESGQAVAVMAQMARARGVELRSDCTVDAVDESSVEVLVHVRSVAAPVRHDAVVACAGAWIGRLIAELAAVVVVTRQEMLMVRPTDPTPYAYPRMPVWGIDPDGDGWYGFPLLRAGVVKLAHEPLGPPVGANVDRAGTAQFEQAALEFLARRIPGLAAAQVSEGRSCLYASTPDDHFIIDAAPGRRRLFVAGGGSGHGFKFGGALGGIVADAVEQRANPLGDRFRLGSRLAAGDATARKQRPTRGFASPPTTGE